VPQSERLRRAATRGSAGLGVVREWDIPEEITVLDAIGSHYTDLFVASVPGATGLSAERWARATIEGAPAGGRFLAWRVFCNLRLGSDPTPGHIAGWRIADVTDRWIRVEAESWFMTANMIFHVSEERVAFATLVRYTRPVGRAVWGTVSAIHRRVAPDFLRAGVRRALRDPRPADPVTRPTGTTGA
jgi:hypothetical protein